jgi:methyl-accepting chemotaxis protein
MMFGNSKEIATLRNKVAALEDDNQRLQNECNTLSSRQGGLESEIASLSAKNSFYSGIFHGMQSFGISFGEFQGSLLNLANDLRQEKDNALDASSTSINSRAAMQQITKNLLRMAQKTQTTAHSVDQLTQRADQIGGIIKLIKEIADQTNLLALNAAIEAARAGEQGRGFAVVADEVRKLAERTGKSTDEISNMINKILQGTQRAVQEMNIGVARVNEGVALANKAGDSVTSIHAGSAKVTQAVDDITHALKEQVSAAREIARKVELIAQGAEENSATVSQTASSARELAELAQELESLAGKFRVM